VHQRGTRGGRRGGGGGAGGAGVQGFYVDEALVELLDLFGD
jgi:hypothetical protein